MELFTKNIRFIAESHARIVSGKNKYKTGDVGAFLKVSKITVYGWLSGNHIPKDWTRGHLARAVNETFGWSIGADDLVFIDLEKLYEKDIQKQDKARSKRITDAYLANVEKPDSPGKRLEKHRKEKNLTLKQLSRRTKDLFPDDKEFQVSHAYIRTIEKGEDLNYSVIKMRGLSTALGLSFEYLVLGKDYTEPYVDTNMGQIILPFDPVLVKDGFNWKESLKELNNTLLEMFN